MTRTLLWRRPKLFLSTLSLRRATGAPVDKMPSSSISIHALLAESDPAPRASSTCWIFLSTLSLRRATNTGQPVRGLPSYFYPRSPCGERRIVAGPVLYCSCISIHALLAESDDTDNSTGGDNHYISIHALLAESDNTNLRRHRGDNDFYPRSPCGERPLRQLQSALRGNFYPRSPCGERQVTVRTWQKTNPFLSTLSLRRATHGKVTGGYDQNDFYPRSPCGERLSRALFVAS